MESMSRSVTRVIVDLSPAYELSDVALLRSAVVEEVGTFDSEYCEIVTADGRFEAMTAQDVAALLGAGGTFESLCLKLSSAEAHLTVFLHYMRRGRRRRTPRRIQIESPQRAFALGLKTTIDEFDRGRKRRKWSGRARRQTDLRTWLTNVSVVVTGSLTAASVLAIIASASLVMVLTGAGLVAFVVLAGISLGR
jgi:hypothetical protein